jgi:AraC-like DNA-binding protein
MLLMAFSGIQWRIRTQHRLDSRLRGNDDSKAWFLMQMQHIAESESTMNNELWENLSWVEQLLTAAEERLGVRLTCYDLTGLLHDGKGKSLLPSHWQTHRKIPVCGLGFVPSRCMAHCHGSVIGDATRRGEPFRHRCWKGLEEIVIPLVWRGEVRALLMAGSWRKDKRPVGSRIMPARWSEEFNKLELLTETLEQELRTLLLALGQGMLARMESESLDARRPGTRRQAIMQFLRYHACGDITLEMLATSLHLTPSRASHLVRELCGASFQELVREERMRRARVLLLSTDLTVGEIATRVGMENEYHFNRAFRRAHGLPPGKFRKTGDGDFRAGA